MADAIAPADVPAGFVPLPDPGRFLVLLGGMYMRHDAEVSALGIRIGPQHLNRLGIAHGGLLLTLADTALGHLLSLAPQPPLALVTANLTADFLAPANTGDWVEAHVKTTKLGKRLVFGECHVQTGDRLLLRASGVFAVVAPRGGGGHSDG